MPTITMANFTARMERIGPPRWVHVRFPRGAMFGEPGNHTKQRQVLEDTLQAATTIREPGGKVELPYRWEARPVAWRGREITEGP
jgi:hypothetical protein